MPGLQFRIAVPQDTPALSAATILTMLLCALLLLNFMLQLVRSTGAGWAFTSACSIAMVCILLPYVCCTPPREACQQHLCMQQSVAKALHGEHA